MSDPGVVRIEPWAEGGFLLLQRLLGDPRMTQYLGGAYGDEEVAERQTRYERLAESGTGRMFRIVTAATDEAVGSVGYWDKTWRDELVYEIGWLVLPEFQGRGMAGVAAAHAIARARSDRKHRFVHAFPATENRPSNLICRRLGFSLIGECEVEYPRSVFMQCNDWCLDLFATTPTMSS
jgi:RimJ/RimL family protein N-acetyltransferase